MFWWQDLVREVEESHPLLKQALELLSVWLWLHKVDVDRLERRRDFSQVIDDPRITLYLLRVGIEHLCLAPP